MDAPDHLLTPSEARADPEHRLWFAFVDAVERARTRGSAQDWVAVESARDAFYADFIGFPYPAPGDVP